MKLLHKEMIELKKKTDFNNFVSSYNPEYVPNQDFENREKYKLNTNTKQVIQLLDNLL